MQSFFLPFSFAASISSPEVSVSAGRIDAVMEHDNRIYIFEFKLNDSARQMR